MIRLLFSMSFADNSVEVDYQRQRQSSLPAKDALFSRILLGFLAVAALPSIILGHVSRSGLFSLGSSMVALAVPLIFSNLAPSFYCANRSVVVIAAQAVELFVSAWCLSCSLEGLLMHETTPLAKKWVAFTRGPLFLVGNLRFGLSLLPFAVLQTISSGAVLLGAHAYCNTAYNAPEARPAVELLHDQTNWLNALDMHGMLQRQSDGAGIQSDPCWSFSTFWCITLGFLLLLCLNFLFETRARAAFARERNVKLLAASKKVDQQSKPCNPSLEWMGFCWHPVALQALVAVAAAMAVPMLPGLWSMLY